jgi:hypothetical protein
MKFRSKFNIFFGSEWKLFYDHNSIMKLAREIVCSLNLVKHQELLDYLELVNPQILQYGNHVNCMTLSTLLTIKIIQVMCYGKVQ